MQGWFSTLGRNRLLKLLSLLLAIALWFAVSGEERTETTINMALDLVNLHANLMVTSEAPSAIQVRVVGPRSIVNNLAQTRLTETLDLAGYKSGQHVFYLGPNSFSFPRGVQVIRIQPNPIRLRLATTLTQTLPIKPVLENNPPQGYKLVGVTTRPAQVTVKGPYSEVSALKSIATLPIDLSHLKENTVIATDLDFKNFHLALKEPVPIVADLHISPKTLTRTIAKIPVITTPPSVKVSPSYVAVTVKGPWPQVHTLNAEDLKARIDASKLSPGRHHLDFSLELPGGVSLVRSRPKRITVTVPKSS